MTIKLSDAERAILANQHDILSYLNTNEQDHHRQLAHNLRHGYA